MIHAHKELLIRTAQGTEWHHLDTVHIKHVDAHLVKEFADNCFMGKPEPSTPITQLDSMFVLPTNVRTITNIADAKRVWERIVKSPFDATFGCWPWDYADALDDPLTMASLEEYGVMGARLVLLV